MVSNEIASITILVSFKQNQEIVNKIVPFKVYSHHQYFKAIPLVSSEEREMAGLPEEVSFTFANNTIMAGEDLNTERLGMLNNIIRELKILRVV